MGEPNGSVLVKCRKVLQRHRSGWGPKEFGMESHKLQVLAALREDEEGE